MDSADEAEIPPKFDEVALKVYDRDAEQAMKSNLVRPERLFFLALVLTLCWMGALVFACYTTLVDGGSALWWLLPVILYVIYLVEGSYASELRCLMNKIDPDAAISLVNRLENTAPEVRMFIQMYHEEQRQRTVSTTDSKGHTTTRIEHYTVRVNTFSDTETFHFDTFDNVPGKVTINDALAFDLVRIRMHDFIYFGDSFTQEEFARESENFKDRCRPMDTYMDYKESFATPGFQSRLMLVNEIERTLPWWIGTFPYISAMILGFSWLYRMLLQNRSVKIAIFMMKRVYRTPQHVFANSVTRSLYQ